MTQFAIAPPLPPLIPDRATDARIQAERERVEPRGIIGTTADAINSEWSTAWIGRLIGQSGFEEDPNYTIDEEEFKRLAEGLPEDMLGEFENVRSPAHAEQIRSQLLDVADARQRLGQLGYVGGAARMIAAMTDPVDIAVGIAAGAATGGAGGVAAVATKADRIRRMVRAGLIGSAANVPNQLLISSLDPQQGPVDVLYAAAGGFIGGNLGASFTGPAMSKLEAIGRQAVVGGGTGFAVSSGAGLAQGDVDLGTIATATLLGGSLGTISSAITNRLTQANIRLRNDTDAGDVLQAAMGAASSRELRSSLRDTLKTFTTTKDGKLSFRAEFDPEARRQQIEKLVNESGLDPETDADLIARLLNSDPDDALAELHGRLSLGGKFTRLGNFTEIETRRGALPARYALVEIDDLLPSHNPLKKDGAGKGFARRENGPPNVRPYHSLTEAGDSILTVLSIAQNPNPRVLFSDTPTSMDGPAQVDPDTGWVLGGNARTMGQMVAYDRPGTSEALKSHVIEAAKKFGLSPEQAAGMNKPMIVRLLDDGSDTMGLSKLLNDGTSAGQSEATVSAAAAANISPDTAVLIANATERASGLDQAADAVAELSGDTKAFGEVLKSNQLFDQIETGKPFTATLFRTETKGRIDHSRGEFYSSQEFAQMMQPILGGTIRKSTLTIDNPLVIWSKRNFLLKLAESGDANAATLEKTLDSSNPNTSDVSMAIAERYIAKVARAKGHDAVISNSELEVIHLGRNNSTEPARRSAAPTAFEIEVAQRAEADPDKSIAEHRIETIMAGWRDTIGADPVDAPPPILPSRKFTSPDDPETPPKQAGDLDFTWVTDAKASLRWIRRSFASILGGSASPEVVRLARAMADDSLLREDGSGNRIAASTWVQRETAKRLAGYQRNFNAATDDWLRANKTPVLRRSAERERFANQVGEALRMPGGTFSDPHLARAVKAARDTFTDVLETAKRHNVRGLENVNPGDAYFSRVWLPDALNKAAAIHGHGSLVELFRTALLGATKDMTPDEANAVARAMLNTIRDLDKYVDLDKAKLASGDDPEVIREALLAEGIDPVRVEEIIKQIGPKEKKGGDIGPAKRRALLDETAAITTPFGTLRLVDLMDSNVERVLPRYTRQMLGASAATEMYSVIRGPGSAPLHTWKAASDALATRMKSASMKAEQVGKELALLNTLDKHVRGIPLLGDTRASRIMRRLRALNYIRLSGTFGFAQVPEMSGIVAEGGVLTMLNSLPAYRNVFKTVRDGGSLDNELLATIEAVTGTGTDRLLNRFHGRNEWSDGAERAGTEVDRALHAGIKFAGDISGMAAINAASQRFAAVAAIQKFWSFAQSGRTPSAKRLAALGMSESDAKRILSAMRTEAELGRGIKVERGVLFGRRVANFDVDKWADQDAAARFVDAIDRWSRRVIQTNDIGNMHPWMVTDWGRSLFQFRSFVAVAWEKQLLHRIQMRDWEAFSSMIAGSFTAGLVYAGQTYIQSLGRDDRKEFLAERLTPGAIARAAGARTAAASFLPALVDTGASFGGYGPFFNFRQSGLSSPLYSVDSSPTPQFIADFKRAATGVISSARGDRVLDRRDVAAITNLLPFQRAIGVNNVLRMFAQRFPENDQ
jgi:hypothetical protein